MTFGFRLLCLVARCCGVALYTRTEQCESHRIEAVLFACSGIAADACCRATLDYVQSQSAVETGVATDEDPEEVRVH